MNLKLDISAKLRRIHAALRSNKPAGAIPEIVEYPRKSGVKNSKTALVSYLNSPVFSAMHNQPITRFSNEGLAITWPKILAQMGYQVDVINWDNTSFKPNKNYDLFVGHGGINFEIIHRQLKEGIKTIYFSTGGYWKFHNKQEISRLNYFYKRHHVKLPRDRYIYKSEEYANKVANGIICLGNQQAASTYSDFPLVIPIDNASYPDDQNNSGRKPKNFDAGKNNFLFFAGSGNIHKGLDILIDAIGKNLDYNLYICTFMDKEFKDYYKKSLQQSNIHELGFVDYGSQEFYEVTSKCNFVIMPSCSEGSPGSTIQCMQQGLIPIVTKEATLDVDDFGYMLANDTVSELKKYLDIAAGLSLDEVERRSNAARETAQTRHSVKVYESNLLKAVTQIIGAQV